GVDCVAGAGGGRVERQIEGRPDGQIVQHGLEMGGEVPPRLVDLGLEAGTGQFVVVVKQRGLFRRAICHDRLRFRSITLARSGLGSRWEVPNMVRRAPSEDAGDRSLKVDSPKTSAAGVRGVVAGLTIAEQQMGVRRSARTLLKINQVGGFDCPGCAWPEPPAGARSHFEFCENGAKAVAEEATLRRVDRAFFAAHPLEELAGHTDHWLGQQGRLAEPMVKRSGATHYEPITWDDAFALMG